MSESGGKVFCVGLWKTGTKSMAEAFRTLGYRVLGSFIGYLPVLAQANNPLNIVAYHKEDTWAEAMGKIRLDMSKFSGFADTPWHFMYREAMRSYPDSKFILTTRATPEAYAQSEHYHELAHGKKPRPQEFYIERYLYHNDMIKKNIPSEKLLEVCIEDLTWDILCEFLGKTRPGCPFPHRNKGKRNV